MTIRTVDLNVDAGESLGPWPMGHDEQLYRQVTSVNLACGFHAGDPSTMRTAVRRAKHNGVAIGAHPGFPDLVGFGRRDMALSPDEVYADIVYQIGALAGLAALEGVHLHHVKPHGALYLQMARDLEIARAVAHAVYDVSSELPLVVLAGSGGAVMRQAASEAGAIAVAEAFPDRSYLPSGQLAPRRGPDALVLDPSLAAQRAVTMVLEGKIEALDGSVIDLEVQTLCVHGDNAEAPTIAAAIREALTTANVALTAF